MVCCHRQVFKTEERADRRKSPPTCSRRGPVRGYPSVQEDDGHVWRSVIRHGDRPSKFSEALRDHDDVLVHLLRFWKWVKDIHRHQLEGSTCREELEMFQVLVFCYPCFLYRTSTDIRPPRSIRGAWWSFRQCEACPETSAHAGWLIHGGYTRTWRLHE